MVLASEVLCSLNVPHLKPLCISSFHPKYIILDTYTKFFHHPKSASMPEATRLPPSTVPHCVYQRLDFISHLRHAMSLIIS